MSYSVTLIPGDGIGPELAKATTHVLESTGITFDWDVQEAGEATIELWYARGWESVQPLKTFKATVTIE